MLGQGGKLIQLDVRAPPITGGAGAKAVRAVRIAERAARGGGCVARRAGTSARIAVTLSGIDGGA